VLRSDAEIRGEVAPRHARVESRVLSEPALVASASRERQHVVLAPRLEHVQALGVPARDALELVKAWIKPHEICKTKRDGERRFERLDPRNGGSARQQIEQ